MGKKREKIGSRSQTLPSSPSHSFSSSSSSDFEFTISLSPRAATSSSLCPADDLFYKGQLLPLHLSPRLSMVRTLLLASSSTSSSSAATASRDSTASSSNDSHSSFSSDLVLLSADCGSSRPSSVSDDDGLKRKVKPLYEKLSHKQDEKMGGVESVSTLSTTTSFPASFSIKPERSVKENNNGGGFSHSFSGNLRYPRRRSCISSCPSSMRSSPSHSGVLSRNGFPSINTGRVGGVGGMMHYPDRSSMEELQSAIQGAIAHCKNSLVQNKTTVISNEI
ncbi:hypothetical protein Gotur_030348 [Gossypium turneri]